MSIELPNCRDHTTHEDPVGSSEPPGLHARLPRRPSDPSWPSAWAAFEHEFGPWLDRLALRLLRRLPVAPAVVDEARDVRQEFLLACMEKAWLSPPQGIRHPKRYLRTCFWRFLRGRLRYQCAQRRRAPAGSRRVGEDVLPGREPHPAARAEAREVQQILGRSLRRARLDLGRRHRGHADAIDACARDGLLACDGETRAPTASQRQRARDALAGLLRARIQQEAGDPAVAAHLWQQIRPVLGRRWRGKP